MKIISIALYIIVSIATGIAIHQFLRKIKTKQPYAKVGKIMTVLAVSDVILGIATWFAFATPA